MIIMKGFLLICWKIKIYYPACKRALYTKYGTIEEQSIDIINIFDKKYKIMLVNARLLCYNVITP